MGLLDEYAEEINFNDVPDAPDYTIEDGIYPFEIGDVYVREGTPNKPDKRWIIFEYIVTVENDDGTEETKKTSEWFQLPEDSTAPTKDENSTLSFYKQRLDSIGVLPENRNTYEREDVVGIVGVIQLRTTKSKKDGKMYQNIAKLTVDGVGTPDEAPPVVAKTATKKVAPKSAPTAVKNPFAKVAAKTEE